LCSVFGLVVVLSCVRVWFGALSMLLKATFYVAKRDVYNGALLVLRSKFQKKKGTSPFSLLLLGCGKESYVTSRVVKSGIGKN